MNTNRLKKFAQETRKKLLEQVSAKVDYVISADTPALREKAELVATIKDEITSLGKQQLVDKVAYTWFNRFVALRYIDVNDYQPLGIKIVSPLLGQIRPQILQEAFAGNIPEDLNVNEQKVLDLLDGRTESRNAENDAYRHLLIGACNYLHRIFPFLFERINDYTELLLPDDLTSQFSILQDLVLGMTEEDCSQVECIGWLYQFYISEKKDEVFAAKSKVKKEDIPAATQLFTPRWIVEYMVQNTVGKIWMQNHPSSSLKQHMPYYIETKDGQTGDYLKIGTPEELTLLDQACGSGHILVYGFELLYKIYEEQGYNPSEIPVLIIKNNLFGFEIDSRAAQLAAMAVLLKAREYGNRLFKKAEIPEPQILCFKDHHLSSAQIKEVFTRLGIELADDLHVDLNLMSQATNLGSLIAPRSHQQELIGIKEQLVAKEAAADLFLRNQINELLTAIIQLIKLSKKYCCVVDNPPYMGGGAMNIELTNFVKNYYPDSKADLMACFMEAGLQCVEPKGILGMINQHSWMFLSSYQDLRRKLIDHIQFDTLLHLGARTFPEISGEIVQNASFTFVNSEPKYSGSYIRLTDCGKTELKRHRTIEAIQNNTCNFFYRAYQKDFEKVPGCPIGYWANKEVLDSFIKNKSLGENFTVKSGVMTGDDERFLRYWYELNISEIAYDKCSLNEIEFDKYKYLPMNKEEGYRKWSGRYKIVFRFDSNGRNFSEAIGLNYRLRDFKYYFEEGISWGDVAGGATSYRWQQKGLVFSARAPMIITDKRYLVGLLNSSVVSYLQELLNPTLSFNLVDLERIPVNDKLSSYNSINDYISNCIGISSQEWNTNILSKDFGKNELIRMAGQDLEEAYDLYQQYWKNKFFQLHKNEEDLNRQFIEIYGLGDELTHYIPLQEITILKEETSIENGQLLFNAEEVFSQFMSYSVGCMFGRYSIDKDGLIIANQGESLDDYYQKIGKSEIQVGFAPDKDNIIPILEDEWFEDDVVTRFYQFLKVTFGEKGFQKNLAFLEDQLGCTVRKYFTKEFYADHIQRYKKRPIYWMFSSPKGYFNVLIYMHRHAPDTINIVLNDYLRSFIEKLKVRLETLKHIETTGSPAEKTRALKEMDKINAMLLDCHDYERNILYPLATERIAIDLDNGVLVNYNCFGKAVKEITGLNDAKTKKKVREFDWIDPQIIR
jgi:type II restriction/modification system DNA methylase subunit YeeA